MTRCVVKVGGKEYEGWKSVRVQRSIEAISGSFSLDFIDSWTPNRQPWGINPQDEIVIEFDGYPVITGFVEVLNASLGERERTYTVQGRDRSADVIDCTPPASPAQFKNITLLGLCNALSKEVGVKFSLGLGTVDNSPVSEDANTPGQTIFERIDQVSRLRGVLFIPDGKGNVLISGRGSGIARSSLVEGENIKSVSYAMDYSQRFSKYTVRSQPTAQKGWNNGSGKNGGVQASATDAGMRRTRPLTFDAEENSTAGEAQKRAGWEASVRAARSLKVTVVVQGWMQADGLPWLINQIVNLRAPKLGIGGTFLITETEFSQDDKGGTETTLTLSSPDAYAPDPTVKKKKADEKAKGWNV